MKGIGNARIRALQTAIDLGGRVPPQHFGYPHRGNKLPSLISAGLVKWLRPELKKLWVTRKARELVGVLPK